MNPEKIGKDIAKLLLLEEITEHVVLYPGAFKPPHRGHVETILKSLNFSPTFHDKISGPTMPSTTKTPGKGIIFISEKTRDNVDSNKALQVWELYRESIPELMNVEFVLSATPVKAVYDYAKNNTTHDIRATFGKGEEERFKGLANREKYPHVEIFDAGTTDDLSATNLRDAIRKGDDNKVKEFLPPQVDINKFMAIFDTANEGLYPKYNYKKVQQTRYKASDVWTNDPDIIEKKDPKKGTGKKPKGSSRRLYTDEDPKDTVGVKFSSRQDIVDTFSKKSFKAKSHARQSQIINLVHQRVRAAYNRAKDPAVKKRLKTALDYAEQRKEASKKKTQRLKKEIMNEGVLPQTSLVLPRGKKVVLQAEEDDYDRGLIVELTNEGGYKIYYWYGEDIKVYPAEVEVDGQSIKPDAKEVYIKFHPELEKENIDPKSQAKHKGNSAPFGSAYEPVKEGDTYEKMAAKGKKAGSLKAGTVRKRLGIPKDKKIPLSLINKELARLKKMDKDPDKKGAQLGDKNQKYYKALQLAKTLKTTTNVNEIFNLTEEELNEKLCKRGKAYIAKRKRAGEKHNPFLAGRAVKVCKGQMSGVDGKQKKDFRPKKGKTRSAQGRKPDIVKEIGINLSNYDGQILPGDVLRAPKGFPLGGKKLEKSIQLKVIKNSREGVNRYKLSLEDDNGKKYSVRNYEMDGEYKGQKLPKWGLVRKSKKNLNEEWRPQKAKVINKFLHFASDYLNTDRPKIKLLNSPEFTQTYHSFGGYHPGQEDIRVVVHNRNMADILRTLAHEMVHRMQHLDDRLDPNSGEDGSPEENEANSLAGVMLRKFGRENPGIYE